MQYLIGITLLILVVGIYFYDQKIIRQVNLIANKFRIEAQFLKFSNRTVNFKYYREIHDEKNQNSELIQAIELLLNFRKRQKIIMFTIGLIILLSLIF